MNQAWAAIHDDLIKSTYLKTGLVGEAQLAEGAGERPRHVDDAALARLPRG